MCESKKDFSVTTVVGNDVRTEHPSKGFIYVGYADEGYTLQTHFNGLDREMLVNSIAQIMTNYDISMLEILLMLEVMKDAEDNACM